MRAARDLRVQLIVNPYSSSLTAKRERAIAKALGAAVDLVVTRTQRSHHAIELARAACADGMDVIIACGGDGTANEVINGFDLVDGGAAGRPAFAVLPAGGTNVFGRALGMPNDPIRSADHLVAALVERRETTVSLAAVDERVFLFAAGVGLDAAVVRSMVNKRTSRRPSDLSIGISTFGLMALERFGIGPRIDVIVDDTGERLRSALVMCGHIEAYTYANRRAVRLLPGASLERGLDFIAPEQVNPRVFLDVGRWGLGPRTSKPLPRAFQHHSDVDGFTVVCDDPEPLQVDGEYLGERTHVHFRTIRDAVRLVS